jgi:hypothetical protein
VRRSTPFGFDTNSSFAANTVYSPSLLYDGNFASNEVDVSYAAYRFRLASTGETNLSGVLARHPTNMPGRVEIIGDNVNLDRARIRAESTAIIRARNLTGGASARVDAPFCSYDLGSSSPPLVFTNLAPPVVQRLSGEVSAWSAIWNNYQTNATGTNLDLVRFHVLVIDNELQTLQPVAITDLALRSPHVVLSDAVTVRDSFFTDATSLHIVGGLNLPLNSLWRSNNVPNLINLTNDGNFSIPGVARFGSDRVGGYANFINRGTNVASSQFIRADRVENSGCIIANSGVISVDAGTMSVQGGPWSVSTNLFTNTFFSGNAIFTNIFFAVVTNIPGKIQSHSDIQIVADDFFASDSYLRAGGGALGALSLSVAHRLSDGGPGTSNYWAASAGFQLNERPAAGGNLLATHIVSLARPEQEVFHTWPSEDRGNSVSGYDNNLALGKLTLDGAPASVFYFNPPSGQSSGAIYVDYLELLNNATNYNETVNAPINIAPNMRIYFANANLAPSKLDGRVGGRLIWVKNYAGALSSTNIVYPSPPYPTGTVVRANVALATSRDDDSDGDTIVNADDPDPFFINQSVGLRIEASKSGHALLSWNALAEATNLLECAVDPQATSWRPVTNFVQGDLTTRVSVRESLSLTNQRIYRVRVTPR